MIPLQKNIPLRGRVSLLVPLLFDLVRTKDRFEIVRVFGLDRGKYTADLICPGSDIVAHGFPWSILEHAVDDHGVYA
jgi:hypothetical protein